MFWLVYYAVLKNVPHLYDSCQLYMVRGEPHFQQCTLELPKQCVFVLENKFHVIIFFKYTPQTRRHNEKDKLSGHFFFALLP